MSILNSNLKHNIGYKSFPTENYIFKEEKEEEKQTHDTDLSANTYNRGCVETTKKSIYEDWSQEERKEEINKRFKR